MQKWFNSCVLKLFVKPLILNMLFVYLLIDVNPLQLGIAYSKVVHLADLTKWLREALLDARRDPVVQRHREN